MQRELGQLVTGQLLFPKVVVDIDGEGSDCLGPLAWIYGDNLQCLGQCNQGKRGKWTKNKEKISKKIFGKQTENTDQHVENDG